MLKAVARELLGHLQTTDLAHDLKYFYFGEECQLFALWSLIYCFSSLDYKLHESSGQDSFHRPLEIQIQDYAQHIMDIPKLVWMLKQRNMENVKWENIFKDYILLCIFLNKNNALTEH